MLKGVIILSILLGSVTFSLGQGFVTGVGGTYGSAIESFGLNVREYLFLGEHICLGPELSYFPKHKIEEHDVSLIELNITGHYIFELTESFGIYPLTGINYSIEKEETRDESSTNRAFGINVGGGFHYKIKNLFPFFEYKYIVGDLSQHVFSFGVLFGLKKMKE